MCYLAAQVLKHVYQRHDSKRLQLAVNVVNIRINIC